LGSGLLNPKKVGSNSPVPPSLAGLYTPPSQLTPEEEEEEAERAWREALALQGGDGAYALLILWIYFFHPFVLNLHLL